MRSPDLPDDVSALWTWLVEETPAIYRAARGPAMGASFVADVAKVMQDLGAFKLSSAAAASSGPSGDKKKAPPNTYGCMYARMFVCMYVCMYACLFFPAPLAPYGYVAPTTAASVTCFASRAPAAPVVGDAAGDPKAFETFLRKVLAKRPGKVKV